MESVLGVKTVLPAQFPVYHGGRCASFTNKRTGVYGGVMVSMVPDVLNVFEYPRTHSGCW